MKPSTFITTAVVGKRRNVDQLPKFEACLSLLLNPYRGHGGRLRVYNWRRMQDTTIHCVAIKHHLNGMELTVYEIPTCRRAIIPAGQLQTASSIDRQQMFGAV
jgi:hypothetical protein